MIFTTRKSSLHACPGMPAVSGRHPSCLHRTHFSSTGTRHRLCIAASVEPSRNTNNVSGSRFFNRQHEMEALAARCNAEPSSITVILGPRSAGKTALLREYMQRRDLADTKCYVNGRAGQLASPSALSSALQRAALPKLAQQLLPGVSPKQVLESLKAAFDNTQERLKLEGSEVTFSLKAFSAVLTALQGGSGQAKQATPLQDVIDAYTGLITVWKQRQLDGSLSDTTPPLLVLDEANKLMTWGDEYQSDRQGLLDFFVSITKELELSHVVLATSEYAFQSWLTQGEVPAVHFVRWAFFIGFYALTSL